MTRALTHPRLGNGLWILISLMAVALDYATGPFFQFPFLYVVPVVLASWYSGRRWGLPLAWLLPLVRLYFAAVLWRVPWFPLEVAFNAATRIVVLSTLAFLAASAGKRARELEAEVALLKGLLRICSFCKRIRIGGDDAWLPLEEYLSQRSQVTFSHGFCADCIAKHYPELAQEAMKEDVANEP